VSGGHYKNAINNDVHVIDIKTGYISRVASMLKDRNSHASISVGGKVYCVGGYIYNEFEKKSMTHSNEIYDIENNIWS
jgi:hypothetical protein